MSRLKKFQFRSPTSYRPSFRYIQAWVVAIEYTPSKSLCCLNRKTCRFFKTEIWKNKQWILPCYKMQSCTHLCCCHWSENTTSLVNKIANDTDLYHKSQIQLCHLGHLLHCVHSNNILIFNKKQTVSIISANKTQGPNAVLKLTDNNIPGNTRTGIPMKTATAVLLPSIEVFLNSMSIFRVLFQGLMLWTKTLEKKKNTYTGTTR